MEHDVDIWRYAILELHARNDDDDSALLYRQLSNWLCIDLRCLRWIFLLEMLVGWCGVQAVAWYTPGQSQSVLADASTRPAHKGTNRTERRQLISCCTCSMEV